MSELIRGKIPLLSKNTIQRRDFLKGLASLGLVIASAPFLCGPIGAENISPLEKKLSFYNIHTGESIKDCVFWADGIINTDALFSLKHLFRDHRTNDHHDIDPDLIHLIHAVHQKTESSEMIHLISGYRSPKSNAMLRGQSCGVARNSQHLCGKAADIMIPGRTMKQVQRAAKALKAGGVGRYSQFVHVDTGRVRYWGPA